jgi:hypothetical protein
VKHQINLTVTSKEWDRLRKILWSKVTEDDEVTEEYFGEAKDLEDFSPLECEKDCEERRLKDLKLLKKLDSQAESLN